MAGNHTWCFHRSDLSTEEMSLLQDLVSHCWNSYHVAFPQHLRHFTSDYMAIESQDFAKKLMAMYLDSISLNQTIEVNKKTGDLTLNGNLIETDLTIDARGWCDEKISAHRAYQKFVGWEVEFSRDIDSSSVFLMDAKVEQIDGYRFMYTLPYSPKRFLVEDTYYSNDGEINFSAIEERLKKYIGTNYDEDFKILRKEYGSLPLELGEPIPPLANYNSRYIAIGTQAGIAHPTTGYSLPSLLQQLTALGLTEKGFKIDEAAHRNFNHLVVSKNQQSFFRLLNRMLFLASEPEQRVQIMDRFYTLPESLIQNFYRGKLSGLEKFKILALKPPVPLLKAMRCLSERTQLHYG